MCYLHAKEGDLICWKLYAVFVNTFLFRINLHSCTICCDHTKCSCHVYLHYQITSCKNNHANYISCCVLFNSTLAVVNLQQLILLDSCLMLLWNFGETVQDQKFILSKDHVLPLIIDALLLDPYTSILPKQKFWPTTGWGLSWHSCWCKRDCYWMLFRVSLYYSFVHSFI